MNLIRPPFALFLTFLATVLAHAADARLEKTDFKTAKSVRTKAGTLVMAELSPDGDAKVRQIGDRKELQVEVKLAGETRRLRFRGPIETGQVQLGPYSSNTAKKIVHEINGR